MFASAAEIHPLIEREAPDVLVGASPWRGGWIAARWRAPPHLRTPKKFLFMHADPVAVYGYTFLAPLTGRGRADRWLGFFWRYLQRLSSHFDATLVGSASLARRLSQHGLHRLRTVPFGVELREFGPERRSHALRAEMLAACGLPASAALVLTVGRHHPEKRLDVVIDAVRRARSAGPVGLYVVGDGLQRRRVERWAAKAGNVHLAGQIDDRPRLAALLASADVLLHGSGAETFGRALAEAVASGLPVVVPDEGGAFDFYAPAHGGFYRTGDSTAAAATLRAVLGRDRGAMSAAASAFAAHAIGSDEDHFDRLYRTFAAAEGHAVCDKAEAA
jgi:alpha-1,6-mannosyltransferase